MRDEQSARPYLHPTRGEGGGGSQIVWTCRAWSEHALFRGTAHALTMLFILTGWSRYAYIVYVLRQFFQTTEKNSGGKGNIDGNILFTKGWNQD